MLCRWVVLVCAVAMGLAMPGSSPVHATVWSSPDCDDARGWDLVVRVRDTRGGVALSFQDPSVASTTLADPRDWRGEQAHYFELSYVATTGTLRFGLDVSRNRVLEATEVLTHTFNSYLYRSFLRAGISVGGDGGRVTDLTVNGTSIGTLTYDDHETSEREILRTNRALRDILITGNLVVAAGKHGAEWPEMRLSLGDDAAYFLQVPGGISIREPATAAMLGTGLAAWMMARRRRCTANAR